MRKVLFVLMLFIAACSKPKPFNTKAFINSATSYFDSVSMAELNKSEKFRPWTFHDTLHECLAPMQGGAGEITIRAWLGHSLAKEKQVVTIYFANGRWRGQLIQSATKSYDVTSGNYAEMRATETVVESTKEVVPVDGWDDFLSKVQALKIERLPDLESLPGGYGCGADGIDYEFQISVSNKYRFFEYCNADEYTAKFWQARNVLSFASLLEKEFGFKYTR